MKNRSDLFRLMLTAVASAPLSESGIIISSRLGRRLSGVVLDGIANPSRSQGPSGELGGHSAIALTTTLLREVFA